MQKVYNVKVKLLLNKKNKFDFSFYDKINLIMQ